MQTEPAPPAGKAAFAIDPAQSELRLLVRRSGPMARLGHNHVIVNRAVQGWVSVGADAARISLALQVPVANFVIDQPLARQTEGSEFADDVSDDARSGTRHNMLGAALLDEAEFPFITVTGAAVNGGGDAWNATLEVQVRGHQAVLVVPFIGQSSPARISAAGTMVLRQTALGLTPFSIMMGALQVQDEITVKFTLVATRS